MAETELIVSPAFMPCRHIFQRLLGQSITRVSIEPWSVWLLFDEGQLHIEGSWKLIGPNGSVEDQKQEFSGRQHFDLWRIAGKKVASFQFADEPFPRFVMWVTDGWGLQVDADDDGMEDWGLTSLQSKVYCNGDQITVFD
jgi:hypothetical protein